MWRKDRTSMKKSEVWLLLAHTNDGSMKNSTVGRHNEKLKLAFQEEISVANDLVKVVVQLQILRMGSKNALSNV